MCILLTDIVTKELPRFKELEGQFRELGVPPCPWKSNLSESSKTSAHNRKNAKS